MTESDIRALRERVIVKIGGIKQQQCGWVLHGDHYHSGSTNLKELCEPMLEWLWKQHGSFISLLGNEFRGTSGWQVTGYWTESETIGDLAEVEGNSPALALAMAVDALEVE